jgi:hypothetical protein
VPIDGVTVAPLPQRTVVGQRVCLREWFGSIPINLGAAAGLLNLFVINDNDFSSTASRIDGLARGARSHVATEGAQLFDLLRNTGSIKNVYEGCAI